MSVYCFMWFNLNFIVLLEKLQKLQNQISVWIQCQINWIGFGFKRSNSRIFYAFVESLNCLRFYIFYCDLVSFLDALCVVNVNLKTEHRPNWSVDDADPCNISQLRQRKSFAQYSSGVSSLLQYTPINKFDFYCKLMCVRHSVVPWAEKY